ncbi:MAG: SPOR domain-containing protein, partial [Methylococcales bacterium]|nr:SPOR domain-containing protein [Methylococcales bacterium]
AGFIGLVFLAAAINQAVRYFNEETVDEIAVSPVEKIEAVKSDAVEKIRAVQAKKAPESQAKSEQDIVIPEFKLDIEKTLTNAPAPSQPEVATPVEKAPEPTAPVVETGKVEPEKIAEPVQAAPEVEAVAPSTESTPEPVKTDVEPEKVVEPVVAFPKIAPAKGMKIQPLPEKETIKAVPISIPEVKKVKVEPVKKVEIKPVEKPEAVKKPVVEKVEAVKVEPVKKVELKSTPENTQTAKIDTKTDPVLSPDIKRYALQLITLSSDAAVQAFQKKHADIAKNTRVVKSGTPEQPRFGVIYGGFASSEEATKAREKLPAGFANALPRKMNP